MVSSTTPEHGGNQTRTALIPSILTSSLRAVFDSFGADINSVEAHGSVATTNGTLTEELREYGVTREQRSHHRLQLDYQEFYNDDNDGEPENPLTDDARNDIIKEIETVLDSEKINVAPDLTVTSLTVRATDERLQEVTHAVTSEFDLIFSADPAEPPVRDQTKRRNAGRGLYNELGFNVTNLNLRAVIETAARQHKQTNGVCLSWGGPEDVRPRSPDRLAIRINEHVLPDKFGMLKPYAVTEDSVLELLEGEIGNADAHAKTGATENTGGEK